MHMLFAVLCLLISHAVSYPSLSQMTADDEENNDLQLELRSILNHLNDNEQIERSISLDEDDSDQDEDEMNKRQGGYNTINADLKCEIECVEKLRHPNSGKGLSVKDAAKACKNICADAYKKK